MRGERRVGIPSHRSQRLEDCWSWEVVAHPVPAPEGKYPPTVALCWPFAINALQDFV